MAVEARYSLRLGGSYGGIELANFRGKTVVVTGAASGLGREISHAFARRGANLALADVDSGNLEKVREELGAYGIRAYAQIVDVSVAPQMEGFCENVYREFGEVDVLCNNAGVSVGGRFQDITLEDWNWILGINLLGVIHGCHFFYPRMLRQGYGHIVNISSGIALSPLPGSIPYVTSKCAVLGFSEVLRAEAAAYNVGVTAVCPGFVLTNIFRSSRQRTVVPGLSQEESLAGTERLLSRRIMKPGTVAERVVEAVEKNKPVVPIGLEVRLGDFVHRLHRGVYDRFLAWAGRKWFPEEAVGIRDEERPD